MEPYADEYLPIKYTFQQDNESKHTSKIVKRWFQESKLKVLSWPSQFLDLDPIENLREILDKQIRSENFSNKGK